MADALVTDGSQAVTSAGNQSPRAGAHQLLGRYTVIAREETGGESPRNWSDMVEEEA